MSEFDGYSFVICGQGLTGRLEVLEHFFRKRFNSVFIIAISSVFAKYNTARATVYRQGQKAAEKRLLNLLISRNAPAKVLLYAFAYALYVITVTFSVFHFKSMQKNLAFIGIGTFPAFEGLRLKKLNLIRRVIYYSIDFFPPEDGSFLLRLFTRLDAFCACSSDIVWSISPKILEARANFSRLPAEKYRSLPVPLTFDESRLTFRPPEEVERWSIVFVGTSGYFHGLHLLLDAKPELVKIFTAIKIKIIGPGPWGETQQRVNQMGLKDYFNFLGFIESEDDLFEIVSRCSLGLALYVPDKRSPSVYADPGKPKLYTFCGVRDRCCRSRKINNHNASIRPLS